MSVPKSRIVCFIVNDPDATDSSSDECEQNAPKRPKKFIAQVTLYPMNNVGPKKETTPQRKYRGVRERACGKFAVEIRDRRKQKRVWLGTHNTAEEAAMAYDRAAIRIHGPKAKTNFKVPTKNENKCDEDPKSTLGFVTSHASLQNVANQVEEVNNNINNSCLSNINMVSSVVEKGKEKQADIFPVLDAPYLFDKSLLSSDMFGGMYLDIPDDIFVVGASGDVAGFNCDSKFPFPDDFFDEFLDFIPKKDD